ncbi:DUF2612 domain-containing protein [Entomobacter blattae]|uniref:Bacteriophage protein n=1 Tax=Entomobacter blattae TaxID=2762277 RepID=A0A7H1NTR8_9PROT|nr:DUF2612 domain-containing protein [Entomobacter blattae]QNT79178.1 hypothetical protein JGUZn3_19730 [Entomobacter blattae]
MKHLEDYTSLVTSQHLSANRFMGTVTLSVAPFVDLFNTLCSLPQLFDIDNAEGNQLDVVGQWVGVSRHIVVQVSKYFSHDITGLGWDEAPWWKPGDPLVLTTGLNDAYYRGLLKAKIIANSWRGDLPTVVMIIQTLLAPVAAEQGGAYTVKMDEGDMAVDIHIAGPPIPTALQYVLIGEYLPLKPAGVTVNWHFPKNN